MHRVATLRISFCQNSPPKPTICGNLELSTYIRVELWELHIGEVNAIISWVVRLLQMGRGKRVQFSQSISEICMKNEDYSKRYSLSWNLRRHHRPEYHAFPLFSSISKGSTVSSVLLISWTGDDLTSTVHTLRAM